MVTIPEDNANNLAAMWDLYRALPAYEPLMDLEFDQPTSPELAELLAVSVMLVEALPQLRLMPEPHEFRLKFVGLATKVSENAWLLLSDRGFGDEEIRQMVDQANRTMPMLRRGQKAARKAQRGGWWRGNGGLAGRIQRGF